MSSAGPPLSTKRSETVTGVCEVWPAILQMQLSARSASRTWGSRLGRASCSCASGAMPMPVVSRGHARSSSLSRRGWSDPASAKRSQLSSRRVSSSSSAKAVRGAATRHDIWSLPSQAYGLLVSPYSGGAYGPLGMPFAYHRYGPLSGQEVRTTHVGGSTAAWRRLPAPTHSLRSLACPLNHLMREIPVIGRLAVRCPSGEEAQGALALGARKGVRAVHLLPAWLRSCRLPAALADDEGMGGSGLRSRAVRSRGGDAWGRPAWPQYARGFGRSSVRPACAREAVASA